MEDSSERIQFLNERLSLLQTTLPVYELEDNYKSNTVKKEIEYLKNELKRSSYISYNDLF